MLSKVVAAAIAILVLPAAAGAATTHISSDPFTQATCAGPTTTNHRTEVEPDSFSNGSTIVSAFQVRRIYDGGACGIGFSTSPNNRTNWTRGPAPGLPKGAGRRPNDRA